MSLPAAAQQTADKADAATGNRLQAALTMQADYQRQHGKFWQGLRTQAEPPKDGQPGEPDFKRKPTDQADDWETTGAKNLLPPGLNTSLAVDTYDGPQGQGWVLSMQFESEGKQYMRGINVGPETYRTHDWVEVVQWP